jgi:hypothetical protein
MPHDDTLTSQFQGARQLQLKAVAAAADRIRNVAMPDHCEFRPTVGNDMVVNADGIPEFTVPASREYRGTVLIPCRADVARAFRPDRFPEQEGIVDELDLHLPLDFVFDETDYVRYDGQWFKIRKLDESNAWDITKTAKIMRLGSSMDYPNGTVQLGNAYSSAYSKAYG